MIRPGKGIYGYERALERAGLGPVAGADEAGRGACAGPLVAAAVILPSKPSQQIDGLKDSKLLSATQRERLYEAIVDRAVAMACVIITPGECDELGMHEADLQGLRRALLQLNPAPSFGLTDGFFVPGLPFESLAVWKGDQVSACVAAASIVAKVTRDRIMTDLDQQFPGYGFAEHKGYCTAEHQEALDARGPSVVHRMRFDNVRRTIRPGMPLTNRSVIVEWNDYERRRPGSLREQA